MGGGTTHWLPLPTAPTTYFWTQTAISGSSFCATWSTGVGGGWLCSGEVEGDPVPQEEEKPLRLGLGGEAATLLDWNTGVASVPGLGFPSPPVTCLCNQVQGIKPRLVVPGVEVEGEGEGLPPPHGQLPAAHLGRMVPIGVLRAMPIHKG